MGTGMCLLALCGVCLALAAQAQVLSTLPSMDEVPAGFPAGQKSVSFGALMSPSSGAIFEIPTSDPLVAPAPGSTPNTPDQIHVTLGAEGTVWVGWSTGNGTIYPNQQAPYYPNATLYAPQTPDPASYSATVQWGLKQGDPYLNVVAGKSRGYVETYLHNGLTYVSQLLHQVRVTGLPYGQTIYYKVGDVAKELSAEFPLTLRNSLKPGGQFTFPLRLGVVADIGQTFNSSVTYQHLVADNPDATVFVGDLSYADDFDDTCSEPGAGIPGDPNIPSNYVDFPLSGTPVYQTCQFKWDTMGRLLQRSGNATSLPYIFLPGNHEIEQDEYLETFQSYRHRYRMDYEPAYSDDPLYYSVDIGPVHTIMLNAYGGYLPNNTIDTVSGGQAQFLYGNGGGQAFHDGNYPQSTIGAQQLSWLLNDLARVDRTKTPWVIVAWHQPPYNSYSTHYKEADCLRETVEPFLYNAGVDIVLHGHVHAYERNYQTYNYAINGCAPRWLTMGDGGNQEGLYRTFAAEAGTCTCPAVSARNPCPCANVSPKAAPQYCTTLQNGLYAPNNGTQPPFSAYREPSFGHAIIDFINGTHAQWYWNRNQDGKSVISDSVIFVRNPACNNFHGTSSGAAPSLLPDLDPIRKLKNATNAIKHVLDPAPGSPKANPLDFLPFGADVPTTAPGAAPKAPSMAPSP
ncbi:hypothetical protein CVIRNUC_007096 [Coccomyxa viridis]|uniref:Purple acid phosphatase n=1 Tax=Coccomyxa viridis TaxID=1274662 RepID=A0AAV1IAK4_9CHLO|nr:hypothetical protein CVIRNUC_007096 [Coccomyxa viridis]